MILKKKKKMPIMLYLSHFPVAPVLLKLTLPELSLILSHRYTYYQYFILLHRSFMKLKKP